MNKDKDNFQENLRLSNYFTELERIKKQAKYVPKMRKLRRKPIKTDTSKLLLMVASDEESLRSAELNIFKANLRNQIFLKRYVADKVEKNTTPRLSMPEIAKLKDKVRNIKKLLKKRIFNNEQILPGMRDSLRSMEKDKKLRRIKEFAITHSSFLKSEREFDGNISKDTFFDKKSNDGLKDKEIGNQRFLSLNRNTTRKHTYRLLKSGYGVKYFRMQNNKKNFIFRKRDSVDGRIRKRKNLAQSFY